MTAPYSIAGKRRAFRELNINSIVSDFDLRENVDEEELKGLRATINDVGFLQPILVSINSKSNEYRLILGGRRMRAARQLGLETIPAFIVDDLTENRALIIALIENMQRADLEPLEEAHGIEELRERYQYSDVQIADTIGKSIQFVQERFALLRLPAEIQSFVKQRQLGVTQAAAIARLEGNPVIQIALAQDAVTRRLSAEILERMIEELLRPHRRYKKINRKHKIKKTGDLLSEAHVLKKLQQVVLRGEELLHLIDGIPLQRWNEDGVAKLHKALIAIEDGLSCYEKRTRRQKRNPDPSQS